MSHTTVSVSRRVVMLKVRPKPGSRKQRSPSPNLDPIVQDRSAKKTEGTEALLDFEFSITPEKNKSKTPLLVVPLWNRSRIVAIAIAVIVVFAGVVLFLRWVIHPESGLPEMRQEEVVTQPQIFNIRPRVNSFGHSSMRTQGRPHELVIGASGLGPGGSARERSGHSTYTGQALSASAPIVPEDLIEMADRKLVLPSDVSGVCSVGSGVVSDLVTCLNRYGAQAR